MPPNSSDEKLRAYLKRGMTEDSLKMIELYNSGATYAEVGRAFSKTTKAVSDTIARARRSGMTVRPRGTKSVRMRRERLTVGYRLGYLGEMIDVLEDDVVIWLVKQTPKGASLSEFMASIVRDAYHDDIMALSTEGD